MAFTTLMLGSAVFVVSLAVAVRSLRLRVSVRSGTLGVHGLLRTTEIPVAAIEDVVMV